MSGRIRRSMPVEDADALYAEYAGQGVEIARGLANPTCQPAMALARVRGEGLRWPYAGFRRKLVVFSLVPSRSPPLQVSGFLESCT
jgi:hypothetical protein